MVVCDLLREECSYSIRVGDDDFNNAIYSEATTIRCIKEPMLLYRRGQDGEEASYKTKYMVVDETVACGDLLDGLVVASVEHLKDIEGVYLYSEVIVE